MEIWKKSVRLILIKVHKKCFFNRWMIIVHKKCFINRWMIKVHKKCYRALKKLLQPMNKMHIEVVLLIEH